MAQIDYFFATMSPYAYLASDRLELLAARQGANVVYKPVDLAGLYARTGGTALVDRHPSRQEYRLQDLRRQAEKLGLKFNLKPAYWPVNGAPAAYAIIAAQKAGGGNVGALVQGMLKAVWADQKDIADDEVVGDLLEANGFSRGLTFSGMLAGADTYASNLEEAVLRGVFGSPFYLVGEERFWGQDRLEDLERYLAR